jgi:hypothetical protein
VLEGFLSVETQGFGSVGQVFRPFIQLRAMCLCTSCTLHHNKKGAPQTTKGIRGMSGVLIKRLTVIFCLALLTACGGDSSDGAQSPADQFTGGSSDSSSSGSSSNDGSGGVVKIGSGTGGSFTEGALAASNASLQAGASTEIVVNLVDADNAAITDEVSVSFSSDCVANALATFSSSSVQTVAGRASVDYTAAGCSGTDTVTATAVVGSSTLEASVDLTIAPDQVLALNFISSETNQLALKGMGSGEKSKVIFQLVGAQGAPIRNELITFSLSTTAGGISLAPDTDGDPVQETVTTDNDGQASVVVRSGTVATNVRVLATHNTSTIESRSQDLIISTGVPVFSKFSLSYGPQAPADSHSTDGISVSVSIIASDQFGNDVFDGTQISFWSPESGNIDSSCVLVSGQCTVSWISAGDRPADGRLTFIAYTNGAEDFTDLNGNNVFDDGEASTDLSEAYADQNENGAYDSGEFFLDVFDADPPRGAVGAWDAASQLPAAWDGPCLSDFCPGESAVTVWRNGVIIIPLPWASLFSSDGTVDAEGCPVRELVNPVPFGTIDLTGGAVTLQNLYISDGREQNLLPCHIIGNPMASGTTIKLETDNGEIVGNDSWTVPDAVQQAYFIGSVTIEPDEESSDGKLKLTVTPPGASTVPTIFTWTVVD